MQIEINGPDLNKFKDRYNGPKFFVALLLPIVAVVATYHGLLRVPDAAGSTVVVLVVVAAFLAFMTYAFNQPSKLWHWAAALVAVIAGVLISAFWASISAAFGNFSFGDVFWLIVALVVDFLFAFWVSRNVAPRAAPNPDTRRGKKEAAVRTSRRQPESTDTVETMMDKPDSTTH